MPRPGPTRTTIGSMPLVLLCGTGLALLAPVARADDGGTLAAQYGCLNCHKGEGTSAPSLKHLSERARKGGDAPQALNHMLEEMREHTSIRTHQRVSDASALGVLKWLAQEGK